MTHRSVPRESAVACGLEPEGIGATEKPRVTRRGRSATPGLASHWEENRRLYMDNLRLWDCLTLVRSDPAMTCQNAIKLVFSLDDDDYFRMFPDTRQLMLLMFPGGVVYHSSSEKAKTENARLKDENARLHAAVWVLRDNPSFQADSTVAAIFRLDEAQFHSKFHSVNVASFDPAPTNTASKIPYQNNNKEKKKSIRTSLGLGHEPTMAIQLTNCPIKIGPYAYDKQGSKASRRPRSQSMMPPTRHSQNNSGCATCQQDFTSNWKPTTPQERHPTGGKIRTSKQGHLKTDWAILCWRENSCLRPVDLYALEETKSSASVRHDKTTQSSSQRQRSSQYGKERRLRRSNTVSREDDFAAERISKGPSDAAPVKCVSFAEPLPSYQAGSSIATNLICLKDKVTKILDSSSDCACSSASQEEMSNDCPITASEAKVCDLKGMADTGSAKNANSNKRGRRPGARSKVYTLAAAREPSKRCQRDTATSPVLDTRTCVLILAKSGRSKLPNCRAIPPSSASDDYMLNKSNNNDSNPVAKPPQWPETKVILKSAKCSHSRPLSPKQRDLRQARLKNMLSCKKLNNDHQIKQNHNIQVTCSTNNALYQENNKPTYPRAKECNTIIRYSLQNREQSGNNRNNEEANEEECEKEHSYNNKPRIVLSSHTSDSSLAPKILFSDKPGTARKTKHSPYSLTSYTTVKQFLDRHQDVLKGLPPRSPLTTQEISDDTASTMKLSVEDPSPARQQAGTAESGATTEDVTSASSIRDDFNITGTSHQALAQKYKEIWNRSETLLDLATSSRSCRLKMISSTTGKLKLCEADAYNREDRLKQLRKLGNYKFSKPLATMLKRNGYEWKPHEDLSARTRDLLLNIRQSSSLGSKLHSMPIGPFITFVPKK